MMECDVYGPIALRKWKLFCALSSFIRRLSVRCLGHAVGGRQSRVSGKDMPLQYLYFEPMQSPLSGAGRWSFVGVVVVH